MEYLLAYDAGTSGTKAVLMQPSGQVLATSYEPYPTRFPRPLCAEQDPEDWWRAVAATTRRVLEASPVRPDQILGLAFSTQMVNAIPLDSEGRPLRPCISWLDGRAVSEAQHVMRLLGGPALFAAVVGVALTGKDLLPKYLWLKRHEPEVYRRAAAIVDTSGYLLFRATGRLVYEWSVASVTGLFNLKTKTWDRGLIRLMGLDGSKFADLVRSYERVGDLTAQAAESLGLWAGTPVFAGAGDAMASALGAGAILEGEAHLCLGTSGYVAIITQRRVVGKRGIVTIQSADPGKLLLIGESETVGACLKWAARELYGAGQDEASLANVLERMNADVADTPPGCDGLIFTPWMYGERSPIADEHVRAGFINLGSNHTRPQLARAIYEGVAYNFRWVLDSIARLYGFSANPLRVIGGGARSLPWLRVIADITGRTLERAPYSQEASAVGAALVAGVGLGIFPTFESLKILIPAAQVIPPNPAPKATYDRLYSAYRRVYRSLRNLYHELNRTAQQA